jgi:hypothetical protein
LPGGSETGDTATHDHDRNIGPRILRHFDPQTIAQAVTKHVRLPNDLARWQRWIGGSFAGSEGDREAEESGKDFATIKTHSKRFHSPS